MSGGNLLIGDSGARKIRAGGGIALTDGSGSDCCCGGCCSDQVCPRCDDGEQCTPQILRVDFDGVVLVKGCAPCINGDCDTRLTNSKELIALGTEFGGQYCLSQIPGTPCTYRYVQQGYDTIVIKTWGEEGCTGELVSTTNKLVVELNYNTGGLSAWLDQFDPADPFVENCAAPSNVYVLFRSGSQTFTSCESQTWDNVATATPCALRNGIGLEDWSSGGTGVITKYASSFVGAGGSCCCVCTEAIYETLPTTVTADVTYSGNSVSLTLSLVTFTSTCIYSGETTIDGTCAKVVLQHAANLSTGALCRCGTGCAWTAALYPCTGETGPDGDPFASAQGPLSGPLNANFDVTGTYDAANCTDVCSDLVVVVS